MMLNIGKMNNNVEKSKFERRIQIAGLLILIGLSIELISLYWLDALSFVFFLMFGGLCIIIGIGLYLISLINVENSQKPVNVNFANKA